MSHFLKLSNCQNVQNVQNCPKLSKIVQNCPKLSKFSKNLKIFQNFLQKSIIFPKSENLSKIWKLSEGVLQMYLSFSWSVHVSSSLWWNVWRATSLSGRSLMSKSKRSYILFKNVFFFNSHLNVYPCARMFSPKESLIAQPLVAMQLAKNASFPSLTMVQNINI